MVQAAYNVLDEVFEQWQKEPYRWMYEADLQAEIGGRLNQIFTLQGLGNITGEYKWALGKDKEKKHIWNRVSYRPYVYYEYEKGKESYCFPDIVIWADKGKIPKNQLWPILWACELKYGSSDDGSDDVVKLNKLITQGLIKFGCSVRIHYTTSSTSKAVNWRNIKKDDDGNPIDGRYLWICDVNKPKLKQ